MADSQDDYQLLKRKTGDTKVDLNAKFDIITGEGPAKPETNEGFFEKYDVGALFALLLLSAANIVGLVLLHDYPIYAQGTCIFALIGGFGGFLVECVKPSISGSLATSLQTIRASNVSVVMAFISITYLRLFKPFQLRDDYYILFTYFAGFLLLYTAWLGQRPVLSGLLVIVFQLIMLAVTLMHSASATNLFIWTTVVQIIAFTVTPPLPLKAQSGVFHSLLTVSSSLFIWALLGVSSSELNISGDLSTGYVFLTLVGILAITMVFLQINWFFFSKEWRQLYFVFVGGIVGGIGIWQLTINAYNPALASITGSIVGTFLVLADPLQFWELKYKIFWITWSVIMSVTLNQTFKIPPKAVEDNETGHIKFVTYSEKNPLTAEFIMPAAAKTPKISQRKFVSLLFQLIVFLDTYYSPDQTNPSEVTIKLKGEPVKDIYPFPILQKPNWDWVDQTREPYLSGRILEWLANRRSGAQRMFRELTEEEKKEEKLFLSQNPFDGVTVPTHVLDLTFLEQYEPKPGYLPYGGKVFYSKNPKADPSKLYESDTYRLEYLVPPRSTFRLEVRPNFSSYQVAQAQIQASVKFVNIVFYHLLEIHVMLDVVAISLHNAFDDIKDRKPSANFLPSKRLRQVLQLHFGGHSLAEEVTTKHLLVKKGNFEQIFAPKHEETARALNNAVVQYQFCQDTNRFYDGAKYRSSSDYEGKFHQIYVNYGLALTQALWSSEKIEDDDLRNFYLFLNSAIPNGLPVRYEKFQSRKGVAFFIADAIHQVTVIHEIYGTKVMYQLDYRFNAMGQVRIDGGLPDKCSNFANLVIGAATALAPYPKLLSVTTEQFLGLVEGDIAIGKIFEENLLKPLHELENVLLATDHMRYALPLPSELKVGAGY